MQKTFINLKSYILYLLIFLFPIFFLPITLDFFTVNKMYLLVFIALILLLISTIQFLISKKFVWEKNPLDIPLIIFPTTIILSIIFSSPNKIQALLNPTFGIIPILSLTIIAYYLSRAKNILFNNALLFSAEVLSLITIILSLPFIKNIVLPTNITFLKNPLFTPIGSPLDLVIFFGFVIFSESLFFIKTSNNKLYSRSSILRLIGFVILALGFFLSLYSLIKLLSPVSTTQTPGLILPPINISWYAAVETLKNPLTALFGIGIDNFSSMFTQVKNIAYNQSSLWQNSSFTISRSAMLHIFTETGLFGLVALGILIFSAFKQSISSHSSKSALISFVYLFICLLFFPPTIFLFFLFYFHLSTISAEKTTENKSIIDVSEILPLYIITPILMFIFISGSFFLLIYFGYLPEFLFYKSINGYAQNNIKTVYDNQRQAIIINPYIERFRLSFSQTNLMIANNVASKASQTSNSSISPNPSNPSSLTEQDRQTISQAIQAAIAEAKAAATLNPQKAGNWENLAIIYRNIINVAQGADTWTISAYQRAIVLDPQNPVYRLNLGGVYYSLNNWNDAYNMFSQSIALKNNWANAYYNFAWAAYQKNDYSQAVNAMQNAINYLDINTSKSDYERAQKELEEFKKKLPTGETSSATQSAESQKQQLALPTPPIPALSPKIELPKNASPESK
jgi:tetratricopeptide (TPR) repeat protein